MSDNRTIFVVFGAIAAVFGGYIATLATTTQFQPTSPDRSDGDLFLKTYYSSVTDPTKVESAWNDMLDSDFKRNLKKLDDIDLDSYKNFWKKYEDVEIVSMEHPDKSEEFKTELVYTFKKGHKRSPAETTYFTLRCPLWTAFTIFGCDENNMRIHYTHRE